MLVVIVSTEPCDGVNDCIPWAAVARVVYVKDTHQQVVDGFDDGSFAQPIFVRELHQGVFHVFADAGDQLDSLLEEGVEKLGQVALVGETFSLEAVEQFVQHAFGIV